MKNNKHVLIVVALLLVGGAYALLRSTRDVPAVSYSERGTTTEPSNGAGERVVVIAENLEIPWDIEFLPTGDMLVTERPGRLLRIDARGEKYPIPVPFDIHHKGEGGLLGLALHPDFERNNFVYLYRTENAGEGNINRVSRFVFARDALSHETVIIDDIPGAIYHDGGQLAFGPDGYLYITTGDATKEDLAQNVNSLAGKILRVSETGGFVPDNPFFRGDHELSRESGYVYSYGHRNPQGLAWDEQERLWSTEHGRTGTLSGLDELNLIGEGKNYGWPVIEGDETMPGMERPILQSGEDETWAPASLAHFEYQDGRQSFFWSGLRGESLYEAILDESGAPEGLKRHLVGQYGRLRAAVVGPDDLLYITTSNRDGRGNVRAGDDKIIRINPELL